MNLAVYMAFVATAANIGDMPTRLEKEHFVEFLKNLDATLIQLELPPLDAWDAPFSHWLNFTTSLSNPH